MMDAQPRIDANGQQQNRSINLAGHPRGIRKRIFQWMRRIGLTGASSATVEAHYIVDDRPTNDVRFRRMKRTFIDTADSDKVLRLEQIDYGDSAQVVRIHAQEDGNTTKLRTVLMGLRPGTGEPSTIDAKFADATLTGYNPPIFDYHSDIAFHAINRFGKNYVIDANVPTAATTPEDWYGIRVRASNSRIGENVITPASGVPVGFWGNGTLFDATDGGHYRVNGTKVVGAQQLAIADPAGQANDLDSEARTAIGAILAAMRTHGLIAT